MIPFAEDAALISHVYPTRADWIYSLFVPNEELICFYGQCPSFIAHKLILGKWKLFRVDFCFLRQPKVPRSQSYKEELKCKLTQHVT